MIKKIKDTSGASMLIALLLLLMCAVVGAVVLTAATASTGRLAGLKSGEKEYYAVSSAVRLLQEEIQGEKYSRYSISSMSGSILESGYYEQPQGDMKNFLKKAADYVYDARGSSGTYRGEWKIRVPDSSIEEVTAVMTMNASYDITVTVSAGDVICTLKIPAVIMTGGGTTGEEILINGDRGIRHTLTLIWTKGEITKS